MRSIYAKPLRIATTIFRNLLRAVFGAKAKQSDAANPPLRLS
jgi:hypothetical protein